MKKRTFIRLTSFLIAAIAVLAVIAVKSQIKINRYKISLENEYSKNLDDFGTSINNIQETLNKARFATTPEQINSMAAKLLTEAEVSKNALSGLPYATELTTLNKFLSQVGNYAMSVSKNLMRGNTITENDTKNIEALSNTANKISELLVDAQVTYNNAEYWAAELDEKVNKATKGITLSDSLGELDEELTDYPTLIYDGPYSDHILEKEPIMIKDAPAVSESEALKTAAETAKCDESELKYDGFVAGKIPAYRFAGENVTVTVSKNGGYAVFMRKTGESGKTSLSYAQAREKAKRYLEQLNKTGLSETYYFTNEGVCVINFAFVDGETICYTDLIKVGVAMDSGEIVLYEASGYLTNHRDRAFETPEHSAEDAEKLLSNSLTIKSTALALIPTNSGDEARCYEFNCVSADNQEILVYINTLTLEEEDILILLKTDGGTLVK